MSLPSMNGVEEESKTENNSTTCLDKMRTSNTCNTNCVEHRLAKLFDNYGRFIGHHPFPFLIAPIIVSCLFGIGFMNFNSVSDTEYLFTPTNGRAKDERNVLSKYFSYSEDGNFSARNRPSLESWAEVIVMAPNEGNVLTSLVVQQAIDLDDALRTLQVQHNGHSDFTFTDICTKWNTECLENNLLTYIYNRDSNIVDQVQMDYPNNGLISLGSVLGGVEPELGESSSVRVQSARAIRLIYDVKHETPLDEEKVKLWFDKFHERVQPWTSEDVVLVRSTTNSMGEELEESSAGIIPMFSITYTLLITFSIVTCLTLDQVRTKGWVAFAGAGCAGLAVLSAFGFLIACGVPFASQVAIMPFLALGIGVDNMFVLVAAWRQTPVNQLNPDRMAACLREAGVSITITSITDILAFIIGATSNFPSVHIFCLFTGISVMFNYTYCMTFLVACIVLDGRREENNKHGLVPCIKCHNQKDQASERRSKCYMFMCGGGDVPENESKILDHTMMNLFRDHIGPFLMKIPVKVIVLVIYVGYLATAIWGCSLMSQGLQLKNLANDNSYLTEFYSAEDQYFDQFGPPVSVMFTGNLKYSESSVQNAVQNVIHDMESSTYVRNNMSDSWLTTYLLFLQFNNLQPSSEEEFVQVLNDDFLNSSQFERYRIDVRLDDGKKKIEASRMYITTRGLVDTNEERDMMTSLRDMADGANIDVTVYHSAFVFFDQYVVILENTLMNLAIASVVMLFVALLLVPHPICALWVAFSIISIETGVVGFMTFWEVSLDSISMINLILCIGFSVDFAAHITYGFITSKALTKDEKAIDALYKLGFPVLQGACSTILGVVVLSTSDSYIFRTFFKTMFLVIFLGLCHGLIFLPVILSFLGIDANNQVHDPEMPSYYGNKDQDKPGHTVPNYCDDPIREKQCNVEVNSTGPILDDNVSTFGKKHQEYQENTSSSNTQRHEAGALGQEYIDANHEKIRKAREDVGIGTAVFNNATQISVHQMPNELSECNATTNTSNHNTNM